MLRPFLIIGVGGSGGKTLRGLRQALTLRLEQAGWERDLPAAWQMIHFDTPLKQDGTEYPAPFLPPTSYKGLVATGAAYSGVHSSILGQGIPRDRINDVSRMFPDPTRVSVDVTKGAGQFRAVGRAVAASKLGDIAKAAAEAINRMRDASALGELETLGELLGSRAEGGEKPNPTVIVVSSIAGGSGAGQYLDVIEAVKSVVRQEPWAHQFFSLLYAPDVFDNVKGTAGIPSNALATVTETMSGFWTQTPSDATLELYRSKGLATSFGSARDRVGAAYPFIIGRQNSRVSFESQGDVYSALSTSMSAWMCDDRVQGDIDEYVTGNWSASVAAHELPDATRLMRPLDQAPPFSSLGFGRVTLGRERFLDYASERMARAVLDRVLFAHTEEDPRFEQRTEPEWIDHYAERSFESFIADLKLDEEAEDRDDVIDQLRAQSVRDRLAAEFRAEVVNKSAHGFDKTGGLELDEWQHRLITSRASFVSGYLAQDAAAVEELTTKWIAEAPGHIIDTIERYISGNGLAVVVELLRQLSRALQAASENLAREAEVRRGWLARVPSMVSEELAQAANVDSIRQDQDCVVRALEVIEDSFTWEAEANLRSSASRLIAELRSDYIDRMREYLASARQSLLSHVQDRLQQDGRENPYPHWPKRVDPSVPRKYRPAPNEQLLVAHEEYPAEFEKLVSGTFEGKLYEEAALKLVADLIRGPEEADVIEDDARWSFIRVSRNWKPMTTGNLANRAADPEKPRFSVADAIDEYQARARLWMKRKGFPFAAYIFEELEAYFSDEIDPAQLKRRKDRFREALTAALGSSEPLVKLNPALLREVHGKAIGEGNRLILSAIPFKEKSGMYEITKSALVSAGVWDDNVSKGWFKDGKVDSIEIFSMSGYPYEPVVMDSVMAPIVQGWLRDSAAPDSRAAFWKWKRGRLLRESVPADPEVFDSMLRGWYAAKALSRLSVDTSDSGRGPKLSVWDPQSRDKVAFPFPLLYPSAAPAHDFPGAVLESIIIALALCSSEGNLEPLRPYHVLMDLGGKRTELSPALSAWIRDGQLEESSPAVDANRAGAAESTLAERQKAVRTFLDAERTEFHANVVRQSSDASIFNYPVSWEIRESVDAALDALRDAVLETKPNSSGV